jgi:CDP-glucose 4,6-dehydratase
VFGIAPVWCIGDAVGKTVEWSKCYFDGGDIKECTKKQIKEYIKRKMENV